MRVAEMGADSGGINSKAMQMARARARACIK